jgi:MFS family permease
LNGILVNRFGQRNTIVGALIALSCFIFVVFFSQNPQVLLTGQLLCGIPWGIFATSAPAYASEMLPMVLRVYFTSWTNMCFIIGQFIASGVLRVCLSRDDEWGFRIPFALQVSLLLSLSTINRILQTNWQQVVLACLAYPNSYVRAGIAMASGAPREARRSRAFHKPSASL